MAVPVVTSCSPNTGNVAGGQGLIINGANFFTPIFSTVTIGGTVVTAFQRTDSIIEIFNLPAHAAGVVDVTVTNADGTGTGVGVFTYTLTPTIFSLNVPYGPAVGGTVIGIEGSGLLGTTSVSFGGIPGTIIKIISAFEIICTTPAHAAGPVAVSLVTPDGVATISGAYTYRVAASPITNVIIFDDCCHLWISTDSGDSWIEGFTPTGDQTPDGTDTLLDPWSDCLMAANDANYTNLLAVDNTYNGAFGVLALSTQLGMTGTWTCIDPELNSPAFVQNFLTFTECVSAAYSANGTMLTCPQFFEDPFADTFYPRISRDNGATWGDVTGLPGNVPWSRACFSAGATTMYIKPAAAISGHLNPARLFKSTNGGVTWTQLAGGPDYIGGGGAADYESEQRLRCNADGTVIGMVALDGNFWLSRDGGAGWSTKDFNSFFGHGIVGSAYCDFGMSDDTQTIIVGFGININSDIWPGIAVSTDGGLTWTDRSPGLVYPASAGTPGDPTATPVGFTSCNVSPDGLGMVVCFLYLDFFFEGTSPARGEGIMYANVSLDAGVTWSICSYFADQIEGGSFLGLFTASYITPLSTPPPPPFIPPHGGYIIERLDNRVWPTVENCWCVDCGFTLAQPKPPADLTITPIV